MFGFKDKAVRVLLDGPVGVAGAEEFVAGPRVGVIVQKLLAHLDNRVGGQGDELRDVGRPARGDHVFEPDGRAGLAPLVNAGQIELGIVRICLRGKDQPPAVGRPGMPGVHAAEVAVQPPGLAPCGRDDEELAVGLEQHVIGCLAEDNPPAIGREFGEVVAAPVCRGARQRLGLAALAAVESHAVEVVLELFAPLEKFLAFLRGEQDAGGIGGLLQLGGAVAGKDHPLTVRAPGGVALHISRVIGAGQREELPGLAVIDGEDAFEGEEELRKGQVGLGDEDRAVLDRAQDVTAIGGDLREQAEGLLSVLRR